MLLAVIRLTDPTYEPVQSYKFKRLSSRAKRRIYAVTNACRLHRSFGAKSAPLDDKPGLANGANQTYFPATT